ncbi:2-keto-4-pentenoate hydratase [Cupriavidus taiwanensis]|uniref:2-keto-4-pentenoate hydratase n=1 Tax=Cupriavidus taiwanensis TaxID=164546 RepID=A0A975XBD3_9BURK|nr:fumarylacetoacetate hydrolase family protein [Cupriavidus taiwanensis]SOY64335.1 2-keto-4-pentenoate hydratase [Cupriavidus taiwanensis]
MPGAYKLVTYSTDSLPARAGIVVNNAIFDIDALFTGREQSGEGITVQALLEDWPAQSRKLSERAGELLEQHAEGMPLSGVRLHAPLLQPGTIYCAGANYRDHVAEMSKALNHPMPDDLRAYFGAPWFFIKPSRSCVIGPQAQTKHPEHATTLDWEAELAAVIGKPARNVAAADALQYLAGYTIANDLSARDLMKRPQMPAGTPFHFDWTSHKAFEGACPMGPWITPAEQVPDPQALGIRLCVNGVVKQDSNTSQMIFSLAEQIAHLSRAVTLQPGDVILTGTPAGVGAATREFLAAGDRVQVEINRLGTLESSIA